MGKKYYLCMEMSGKGSISRMSDECLMKGKSGISYFGGYQAGMRKFTLALKISFKNISGVTSTAVTGLCCANNMAILIPT